MSVFVYVYKGDFISPSSFFIVLLRSELNKIENYNNEEENGRQINRILNEIYSSYSRRLKMMAI